MQGFKVFKALKVQRARCRARRSLIGRKSNSKSDSNSAGGCAPAGLVLWVDITAPMGNLPQSLRSLSGADHWPVARTLAACRRPAFGLGPCIALSSPPAPAMGQPVPTYPSAEQRRASAAQALAPPQLSGRRQAAPWSKPPPAGASLHRAEYSLNPITQNIPPPAIAAPLRTTSHTDTFTALVEG